MRPGTLGRYLRGFAALALLCPLGLLAQDSRPRTRARITDMDFNTVRTPMFRETTNSKATPEYEWLQAYLEYETEGGRKGWTDEITIEWSLLVLTPSGKPILLQETATYVDVENGKHRAVMYLRPGFIRRYCETKRPSKSQFAFYVEVVADGQRVARQEYSKTSLPRNWWRAKEPDVRLFEAELLRPEDTPFAAMDYDFYEHAKRQRP